VKGAGFFAPAAAKQIEPTHFRGCKLDDTCVSTGLRFLKARIGISSTKRAAVSRFSAALGRYRVTNESMICANPWLKAHPDCYRLPSHLLST
jgi:hypothetical protein